jgi:outer membrane usher protein
VETAVVYAGRHISVSRPVSNSFVLVAPYANIRGTPLLVNASDGAAAARAGILGAVIPDIRSYDSRRIRVDAQELPVGYDLGEGSFTYLSTYKSGGLIRVGTNASVFAGGVLLDGSMSPLPRELGRVYRQDDPSAEPIEFFTDNQGAFFVYGLRPGAYRLVLLSKPDLELEFAVPERTVGLLDLGRIALSPADPAGGDGGEEE